VSAYSRALTSPIPKPIVAPKPRFRVWKWAAAGAAATFLTIGIAQIAIDGSGTNCDGPTGTPCMDLYDTMTTGVLFTLVGAAAAGVSTWMFLDDHKRQASSN